MPVEFADVPALFDVADALPARRRPRFGAVESLGTWLATCQGVFPPRPLGRARLVVFAADHGIAAREVSARRQGDTARMVEALRTGVAPAAVFAAETGAGLRVVDVAVDHGPSGPDLGGGTPAGSGTGADSPGPTGWDDAANTHVRDASGAIDVEDALGADEVEAAVRAGARIADDEVEAGADVLLAAGVGVGASTPAATLVAALTGTEPVAVVGRGSGIDDATWMRKAVAVRDGLRRARPVVTEPLELLRTAGGADLAALAGFLAQAAVRRTPVLLDGLVVSAAALLAEELAPGARAWWAAAQRGPEPAQGLALEHLDLDPVVELGIAEEGGYGALAVLPLLSLAARVSGPPADD